MSQGKEYTKEQKDKIIKSLKPHLEIGFSRNKACDLIGLAPQTLSNWVKLDESLSMELQSAENTINTMVMANLHDAIRLEGEQDKDARKDTSKWWAERKMKEDFSTRTEQTGADGKDLVPDKLSIEKANNALSRFFKQK